MTVAANAGDTGSTTNTGAVTPPPATAAPQNGVTPPAPAASAANGANATPTPTELGDDGEIKQAERYTLTGKALQQRVERGSRASMREHFGTDDPATIKAQLDEAKRLKQEEDTRRRASLDEATRLREDVSRATQRAEEAEGRLAELEEQQVLSEHNTAIQSVANEFLKPKYYKVAATELADYLSSEYTPDQLDEMRESEREGVVRGFFEKFAKENPELAKEAPAATTTTNTPAVKVPLTTGSANPVGGGADGGKPGAVITSGPFAGKTAKPGQANSMTAAEFAQWKKSKGL